MFFKITQGMVELPPEYHPVPRHQPAARGQFLQFQRLQPSVDDYRVRLLSQNHPGLECSPSGASGGRVTAGVQAASAVTLVTSPHYVYILHELFFCTCSCLSSYICTVYALHVLLSLITDYRQYRVARHPLEDSVTY